MQKTLAEYVAPHNYKFTLYKDGKKLKDFESREAAIDYAENYSYTKQPPQVNPNIILPAEEYIIKLINTDTHKTVAAETYVACLRTRSKLIY